METFRTTFAVRQPTKGLVTLFIIALNAVRLPFWLFYYIPPFLRQHKTWSHKKAVRVRVLRAFLDWASYCEMKTPLSLKPGHEASRFVVVPPAPSTLYTGSASVDKEIRPQDVGGTWYPAEPSTKEKPEMVVLHFHGGAYAIGDGRTQDAGFAAKTFLGNTDATHVFAPQYRLSTNPGGRFPAQLQDAITSYNYLLDTKGIDPARIVVSGDSAGANLVLALLRHISDNKKATGLPNPVVGWLWSPWTSPHAALKGFTSEDSDSNPNYYKDYVTVEFGAWGARGLVPATATGLSVASPEITFLDHPFSTDTPLFISAGECESLLPDILKFAEQIKNAKGNKVELQIEDSCPHDTILVGRIIGFEKEAAASAVRANAFLKNHAKGAAKGGNKL